MFAPSCVVLLLCSHGEITVIHLSDGNHSLTRIRILSQEWFGSWLSLNN